MLSVILSIFTIFGLFFQVLTLNEVSFLNYIPNIVIPILIFSYFKLNINYHTILFFLVGLSLDSSNPLLFGTFTFSFMLISYLITLVRGHIDLHIFINKLVLITICNAIFYTIFFLITAITYQKSVTALVLSLVVGVIFNSIFSIIIISILDLISMLKLDYTNE